MFRYLRIAILLTILVVVAGNQVLIIIAHELMHILGASDKYDSGTGQPIPPDGLANPSKSPLYPQQQAEIMGGRIATSSDRWRRPARLKSCVIGAKTAAEIGWG